MENELKLVETENEQPLLSVCYIVKNDLEALKTSVATIKDLADEIIILDTGSDNKDEVFEFIENNPHCKFTELHYEFTNFSEARNLAKEHASGKWILMIDSDENFAGDAVAVREKLILSNEETYGFMCLIRNIVAMPDGSIGSGDAPYLRLFRNLPEFNYTGYVHEDILPSILKYRNEPETIDMIPELIIEHYGYIDPEEMQAKLNRNMELLTREINEKPSANAFFRRALLYKDNLKQTDAAENDIKQAIIYSETIPDIHTRIQILNVGAVLALEILMSLQNTVYASQWLQICYTRAKSSIDLFPQQILPRIILGELNEGMQKFNESAMIYRDCIGIYQETQMQGELYPVPVEFLKNKLANCMRKIVYN